MGYLLIVICLILSPFVLLVAALMTFTTEVIRVVIYFPAAQYKIDYYKIYKQHKAKEWRKKNTRQR